MATLTQARAREYFNYEPETGHLHFKQRPASEFTARAAYAKHLERVGKIAGSPNNQGYIKVCADGGYYSAHRVAWLIAYGDWVDYPRFEIDHINGDRSDNRLVNLRLVTKSQNQRNAAMRTNNSSGVHGVNWVESKKGWVARIWAGSHHVYLGKYTNLREAAIARAAAERVLGYTGMERQPRDHREYARSKAPRSQRSL